MPKSCIPGYDEAIAEERRLREEIFLDVPHDIRGIKVQQITPLLLARLLRMESPFIAGDAEINEAEIVRFLWALSSDFSSDAQQRLNFISDCAKRLSEGDGWIDAELDIEEFMDATFLDAPYSSGGDSVPYVSSIAWMIYTMAKEPFRWDESRTLNTPLRKLYQYTRCLKLDKDAPIYNRKSDKLKADWLRDYRDKQGGNN